MTNDRWHARKAIHHPQAGRDSARHDTTRGDVTMTQQDPQAPEDDLIPDEGLSEVSGGVSPTSDIDAIEPFN